MLDYKEERIKKIKNKIKNRTRTTFHISYHFTQQTNAGKHAEHSSSYCE